MSSGTKEYSMSFGTRIALKIAELILLKKVLCFQKSDTFSA